MMQLKIFAIAWFALAFSTIVLAIYRRLVSESEDDTLHVGATDGPTIARQATTAARLDLLDRRGKRLTGIAFLSGIALALDYAYEVWRAGFQLLP